MQKGKRILEAVLLAVVAIVAGAGIYASSLVGKINHFEGNTNPSFQTETPTVTTGSGSASGNASSDAWTSGINTDFANSEDVLNILLVGCDQRNYTDEEAADPNAVSMDSVRTDTIMICSINRTTNQITLVSLMRDLYVPIPGYGSNRINSAYTLGGKDLLVQTIETDFGIPIDGTVAVNLDEFLQVMDVVGNVDVELTEAEAEYINDHSYFGTSDDEWPDDYWHLTAGVNTLTPEQALAYARVRKFGNSDYDRTTRQRKLLYAVFQKVSSSNVIKQLQVLQKVLPALTTDMDGNDLLGLAYTAFRSGMEINNTYRLPVDGAYTAQYVSGMSVLVPDLAANTAALQSYLYGDGSQESNIDESTTTSTDDTLRKRVLMNELKESLQSVQESWDPQQEQEVFPSEDSSESTNTDTSQDANRSQNTDTTQSTDTTQGADH